MKALLAVVLFAACGTACVDEHGSGGRISVPGAPELRFAGHFSATASTSGPPAVHVTYLGRTIRYEHDVLYVDDRQLTLPPRVRVIEFDGDSIRVDGRELRAAGER